MLMHTSPNVHVIGMLVRRSTKPSTMMVMTFRRRNIVMVMIGFVIVLVKLTRTIQKVRRQQTTSTWCRV